MVLLGMVTTAVVFVGFARLHNLLLWSLLCLVMGGALALRWAGMDTWINSSFPNHMRGSLTGLYELILSGSMAVGPGILALSDSVGPVPFIAGAVTTAAAAILLLFAGQEAGHLTRQFLPKRRREILRHEPAAFIGIFLVGFTEAGNLSLLPLFGLSDGLSAHLSALLVTAVQSGVALGAVLIGSLSDHLDHQKLRNVTIFCMIVLPFGLVLSAHGTLWPWLLAWGIAQGGLFTLGIVQLASRHFGLELASAMSLSMIVYTIGGVLGPPTLGLSMNLAGPHGFTAGITLVACAGAVAISRFQSTRPPCKPGNSSFAE